MHGVMVLTASPAAHAQVATNDQCIDAFRSFSSHRYQRRVAGNGTRVLVSFREPLGVGIRRVRLQINSS